MLLIVSGTAAQVDEICAEAGLNPSLENPFAHVPYVYGRVVVTGLDPAEKWPKVTVIFSEGQQSAQKWMIEKSGGYCFKRKATGNAVITVELNGLELARRTVTSFGAAQQREDFEIAASPNDKNVPPGVVSAKYARPPNPATIELYKQAAEAEAEKDSEKTIGIVKKIVAVDPEDFVAWAKLGSLYFEDKNYTDAQKAFKKSLELKLEYVPAWINFGMMRMAQKEYAAAVEVFSYAASLEQKNARIFELLGEAYLQNKQGTLGAQALNYAIKLDPVGMAECHLKLAHLYELANANKLATREYKLFLEKVPDYKDKKRLEEFISKNPE